MNYYIYQQLMSLSDYKFQLFENEDNKEEIEKLNPGYVFYEVQL